MATTEIDIFAGPGTRSGGPSRVEVRRASHGRQWRQSHDLIVEYLEWASAASGLDPFTVQPWLRDELAHLDEWYRPPRGIFLLATVDRCPAGVIGVSAHDGGWAEIKRLYVRPVARGHHIGERLVWAALDAARDLGGRTVRLETLPGLMEHAVALYRRLGFHSTRRFDETAIDGLLYLERSIDPTIGRAAKEDDTWS